MYTFLIGLAILLLSLSPMFSTEVSWILIICGGGITLTRAVEAVIKALG